MKTSAVIATHTFSPGTSQGLYQYMLRHNYDVIFIEHKLFGNPVTWAMGTVDTLWQVLKKNKKYDLYVGSNRLNAFVGIILKWLGRVKKVVYFSPDWSAERFSNPVLNGIFQKLDYFCVKFADVTWNSSAYMKVDFMMQERKKLRYPKELMNKQTQVPDGTDEYPVLPFGKVKKYKIGYVGHIIDGTGLDLVIDSFAEIKKKIPKLEVLVIGSGPSEERLKEKARGMNIKFQGFVGEIQDVYKLLEDCAIAVATYQEDTISQYTDPGKVKVYLSVALPIIITKVPQIAHEIHDERCGVAINYNVKEFTVAVIKLLSNEKLLKDYRENTKLMAKKYSWDKIFDKALAPLL